MNQEITSNIGEIVLYQPDETIRLEVRIFDDTFWLTQTQISVLFGRDRTVIGRHIRNIFSEGELQEDEACAIFAHTTKHGAMKGKTQTLDVQSYNLDLIISVGYRVKSNKGIAFRRWAREILKQYLLKGYAINHRIDKVESLAIETKQEVTEIKIKLGFLTQYVEDILSGNNDINEDMRAHIEAIIQQLAELQSKNKLLEKPRNRIGYQP